MLNKLQFQNLAELQLQNLDQPLCSKSEKSLVLGPNVSSQICNKTVANMILAININNSNNLNKFWVAIFTRQGQINQVY